ncbi:MAG: hypothetical protein IE935_01115, partial [Micrococcales bacterium]|nr:hypothetical protein [Micrococcales bacterium]
SGTAGGGAGAADAATGAGVLYDEDGNVISGTGTGGTVAGAAVASPFTVAPDGWGWQQSVMLFAFVLLLAAVVAPPLLLKAIRSAGGPDGKGGRR